MMVEAKSNSRTNPDPLLTSREAAEYLGISPRYLEALRHRKSTGPRFTRPSGRPQGRPYYRVSDLEEWLRRGYRWSTSDQGQDSRDTTADCGR